MPAGSVLTRNAPADVGAVPVTGPRDVYAAHFGLRETPFSVTPDPRFFYVHPVVREAYATLVLGVTALKGFMILTGEPGTGKTTLVRRLVRNLESQARFIVITNPTVTFDELLTFVCQELGVDTSPAGRLAKFNALHQALTEERRRNRTVVLVIDEAQHLGDEFLEQLRLLSNLESSTSKLLQVILVGQPELDPKLDRPELRQFKNRIALRARLDRLEAGDVEPYVESRLVTAGCRRPDLFDVDAIEAVATCSQGLPRLVNVLCDNALLVAYGLASSTVTRAAVLEAARDLGLAARAPSPLTGTRTPRSTIAEDAVEPSDYLTPILAGAVALVVGACLALALAVTGWDGTVAAWWRGISDRFAPSLDARAAATAAVAGAAVPAGGSGVGARHVRDDR
jgi:general secretion pathway protein A